MKKILIGLIAFASLNAFASNPGDGEFLSHIGFASEIKIIKDINIPYGESKIWIGKLCILELNDAVSFDRVLPAGKILKITSTTEYPYSAWQLLHVNNAKISSIACRPINEDAIDKSKMKKLTIGDFKEVTKEFLQIKPSKSTEI